MNSEPAREDQCITNSAHVNTLSRHHPESKTLHRLRCKLRRIEITLELGRDSDELRRKEAHLRDLLGIVD